MASTAGQSQWSVTFQANATYTYLDENALNMSRATFSTVPSSSGSVPSESTPSPSYPGGSGAAPIRGTLVGIVRAGKLTLTRNGQSMSAAAIKAGRYTVAVDDLTKKRGFTLQGSRKQPVTLTSAAFVGRHSVTVTLTAGRWEFFWAGGKKSSFTVS